MRTAEQIKAFHNWILEHEKEIRANPGYTQKKLCENINADLWNIVEPPMNLNDARQHWTGATKTPWPHPAKGRGPQIKRPLIKYFNEVRDPQVSVRDLANRFSVKDGAVRRALLDIAAGKGQDVSEWAKETAARILAGKGIGQAKNETTKNAQKTRDNGLAARHAALVTTTKYHEYANVLQAAGMVGSLSKLINIAQELQAKGL